MNQSMRQERSAQFEATPVSPAPENRESQRFTLLIRAAKLVTDKGEFLCVVRDVSDTGLSVTLFHALPPFRRVIIEFQNGDRHLAEPVWQRDDRAGFRFLDGADIVRIIESPSDFSKRPMRVSTNLAGLLQAGLERHEVEMLDISQQGARLACDVELPIDRRVKLLVEGLPETDAKVRWRRNGECGVVFENHFQIGELAMIVAAWRGIDL